MTLWAPVGSGRSGARVWRAPGLFRKADRPARITAEADRLRWLAGHGIPVPTVVDRQAAELTTTALPGRAAATLTDPAARDRAVDGMAALARALHTLPAGDCPFARPLPAAIAAAAAGAVDLDNLDEQRRGWTIQRLLDELHRTRPAGEDPVVCHGDLTLDNVLVDDAGAVTGLVDVGGLGVADRYQDLALLTRDLLDWSAGHAERFLTGYGLPPPRVDAARVAFYQLLDEFF